MKKHNNLLALVITGTLSIVMVFVLHLYGNGEGSKYSGIDLGGSRELAVDGSLLDDKFDLPVSCDFRKNIKVDMQDYARSARMNVGNGRQVMVDNSRQEMIGGSVQLGVSQMYNMRSGNVTNISQTGVPMYANNSGYFSDKDQFPEAQTRSITFPDGWEGDDLDGPVDPSPIGDAWVLLVFTAFFVIWKFNIKK